MRKTFPAIILSEIFKNSKKQKSNETIMNKIKNDADLIQFLGSCKGINAKKVYATIKKERNR